MEKAKEIFKKVFKGMVSILSLTLVVTIGVKLFDGLYDHRIILGVAVGAFYYDFAYKLFSKIDGLE